MTVKKTTRKAGKVKVQSDSTIMHQSILEALSDIKEEAAKSNGIIRSDISVLQTQLATTNKDMGKLTESVDALHKKLVGNGQIGLIEKSNIMAKEIKDIQDGACKEVKTVSKTVNKWSVYVTVVLAISGVIGTAATLFASEFVRAFVSNLLR